MYLYLLSHKSNHSSFVEQFIPLRRLLPCRQHYSHSEVSTVKTACYWSTAQLVCQSLPKLKSHHIQFFYQMCTLAHLFVTFCVQFSCQCAGLRSAALMKLLIAAFTWLLSCSCNSPQGLSPSSAIPLLFFLLFSSSTPPRANC